MTDSHLPSRPMIVEPSTMAISDLERSLDQLHIIYKMNTLAIEPYRLGDSLRMWFQEFELAADHLRLFNLDKCIPHMLRFFPPVVRRSAALLSVEARMSWPLFKKELLFRFGKSEELENMEFARQLRQLRQNKNEDPRCFTARWEASLRCLPDGYFSDEELIGMYIQSLLPSRFRKVLSETIIINNMTKIKEVTRKTIDLVYNHYDLFGPSAVATTSPISSLASSPVITAPSIREAEEEEEEQMLLNNVLGYLDASEKHSIDSNVSSNSNSSNSESNNIDDIQQNDISDMHNNNNNNLNKKGQQHRKQNNRQRTNNNNNNSDNSNPPRLYNKQGKPICGYCGGLHRNKDCRQKHKRAASASDP